MVEREAAGARASAAAILDGLTAEIFQSKVLKDYRLNFCHSCAPVEVS